MRKVLIAEDSHFEQHLLATALQQKGYQTLVAEDTLQACMLALRNLPDAIVLDINMPGGSGIEVMKRLRRSTKTREIPIIVVSGNYTKDVVDAAMDLGAAEFLPKPVNIDELCALLTQVIPATVQ